MPRYVVHRFDTNYDINSFISNWHPKFKCGFLYYELEAFIETRKVNN